MSPAKHKTDYQPPPHKAMSVEFTLEMQDWLNIQKVLNVIPHVIREKKESMVSSQLV
jgi:hypothetical protein